MAWQPPPPPSSSSASRPTQPTTGPGVYRRPGGLYPSPSSGPVVGIGTGNGGPPQPPGPPPPATPQSNNNNNPARFGASPGFRPPPPPPTPTPRLPSTPSHGFRAPAPHPPHPPAAPFSAPVLNTPSKPSSRPGPPPPPGLPFNNVAGRPQPPLPPIPPTPGGGQGIRFAPPPPPPPPPSQNGTPIRYPQQQPPSMMAMNSVARPLPPPSPPHQNFGNLSLASPTQLSLPPPPMPGSNVPGQQHPPPPQGPFHAARSAPPLPPSGPYSGPPQAYSSAPPIPGAGTSTLPSINPPVLSNNIPPPFPSHPRQHLQQPHLQQPQQIQQQPQPQQIQQPQKPSAPVPIIPRPEPPNHPYPQTGLEAYYPKARFINCDFGSHKVPPVGGRAVVLDDGNASPHIWASTIYNIPMDSKTLKNAGFTNGEIPLMVTPMALPSQEYNGTVGQSTHLPSLGLLGFVAMDMESPERCSNCGAYANPLMMPSGICNFCGTKMNSCRRNVGTIDYPVEGPYVTRSKPVQPHTVWAVDLTAPNCVDYLRLLVEEVLPTWKKHSTPPLPPTKTTSTTTKTPTPPAARAGIILVSAKGVYIPIKGGAESNEDPPFFVMPDMTEDPFSPLPLSEYTYDLQTEWTDLQTTWERLLDSVIPKLLESIANDKISPQKSLYEYSCGGAAVQLMVDALLEGGGRAVWVSWRRPNYGVGKLLDRQSLAKVEAYSTKEYSLYTASETDTFYSKLATTAAKSQVAVDIVLLTDPSVPKAYMDIGTLQQVCLTTNGRLTWINSKLWQKAYIETLIRPLQFTGWDAVLKVRVSNGLRVKSLESSVGTLRQVASLTDDSPELELAVVTPDTSIGIYLQHRIGGLPKNSKFVYIQAALLYTNPWNGQRRVRVSTLALRVATTVQHVFSSMEFNTLAASMIRQAVTKIRTAKDTTTIQEVRQQVTDQCVSILTMYRKYGASINSHASASTQLMLPDKLTLLPLFIMSLLKSPLLRASISRRSTSPDPLADDRAYQLYYAAQVLPATAFWSVFPLIVDIHSTMLKRWQHPGRNLPEDAIPLDILKLAPYLSLPEPIMASISELQDDHSYLLVTPLKLYIVIGKDVSEDDIKEIQAVVVGSSRGGEGKEMEEEEEEQSSILCGNLIRLLKQIKAWSQVGSNPRWLRSTHETIDLVPPQQVASWLVADPTTFAPDYVNFLKTTHQQVYAAYTK